MGKDVVGRGYIIIHPDRIESDRSLLHISITSRCGAISHAIAKDSQNIAIIISSCKLCRSFLHDIETELFPCKQTRFLYSGLVDEIKRRR